jgi:DNA-binding transcriptional ArsR family regulator
MGAAPADKDVFRAVADPTRRKILALLLDSDRSFADLRRGFRVSQPAISQHLRVLRKAGLVNSKQTGRSAVYHLQAKPLEEVYKWAERMTAKKGE